MATWRRANIFPGCREVPAVLDAARAVVPLEWAICEGIVLAILIREWFSIRRELRRDAELRAAQAAQEGQDDDERTPVPALPLRLDPTHAEGQQSLHPGARESLD